MSDTTYECAECGASFDTSQRYATHARTSGHDVTGKTPDTVTPSLLKRAFKRIRFGRDTDGDGDLDIARQDLYRQLAVLAAGTIVGHTLAHDPAAAQQVITTAFALLFGGRAAARLSFIPVRKEWFDSDALDRFGFGLLFGAALVLLPWSNAIDAVMHWSDLGHAPGAH